MTEIQNQTIPADDDPCTRAVRLARNLLGEGSFSCRPFGAGKFSEVFEVRDAADNAYVLRIAPPDSLLQLFYEYRMMRREPAIHRRLLAETSVPAPPILAYDFSRELIDRDYLIMPLLEGRPLSEANLDSRARRRALREWGAYVAQIHGVTDPDNRFGYLGEHDCMRPRASWEEAFSTMMRKELDDIVATGVYDVAEAEGIMELVTEHRAVFGHCRTSRLLHGDLWHTNLLVAPDGRVSGVIDFDRACWGDIEWDLAIAEYCGVTRQPFWEGYGRRMETHSGEAAVRRFFYLLYEHQKYIVISISRRRGDPDLARRYGDECRRAVEQFRRTGQPVF